MAYHDGCILPFLANGICPGCGNVKTLSVPEGTVVRTFRQTVPWDSLWGHMAGSPVWSLFAVRKPTSYSTTQENTTTLWLPMYYVRARGSGSATVIGELFNGYRYTANSGRPQRFYLDVNGAFDSDALVCASTMPLSRVVLEAMGLEERALTCQHVGECEMEELTAAHQVPQFDMPTDRDAVMELARTTIAHYARDRFVDRVNLAYLMSSEMEFDQVEVEVWLVPIHVGSIKVEKCQREPIQYSFLGIGGGKGMTDLPITQSREKLFKAILYGVWLCLAIVFFTFPRGIGRWFAVFLVSPAVGWATWKVVQFLEGRKVVTDDDTVAIEHFTAL